MQAFKLESGNEIVPKGAMVLLWPLLLEEEYRTVGGLVLPSYIDNWVPPQQGEVIAVGPKAGRVRVGDVVVYGLGSGFDVVLDGTLALVMEEKAIIGTVERN